MPKSNVLKIRPLTIILSIIFFSIRAYASNADKFLIEIKKQTQTIREKNCPKNENLSDIKWVKQKLSCLYKIDQYIRSQINNKQEPEYTTSWDFMEALDKKNTTEIKEILKFHGWPLISKFGQKADHQMWLLVQHADQDPIFQGWAVFLIEQLISIGESDPINFAYLYDRVVLKYQHIGLKQKFGTQLKIIGNKVELQPFEGTLSDLNNRRKKIGLEPIEKYLQIAKKGLSS